MLPPRTTRNLLPIAVASTSTATAETEATIRPQPHTRPILDSQGRTRAQAARSLMHLFRIEAEVDDGVAALQIIAGLSGEPHGETEVVTLPRSEHDRSRGKLRQ